VLLSINRYIAIGTKLTNIGLDRGRAMVRAMRGRVESPDRPRAGLAAGTTRGVQLGVHPGDAPLTVPTEVEITFTAEGAQATRVALEHRGFERLGQESGEKLRQDVDGGWLGALESYAEAARQAR
jgi:hypothetical protein